MGSNDGPRVAPFACCGGQAFYELHVKVLQRETVDVEGGAL